MSGLTDLPADSDTDMEGNSSDCLSEVDSPFPKDISGSFSPMSVSGEDSQTREFTSLVGFEEKSLIKLLSPVPSVTIDNQIKLTRAYNRKLKDQGRLPPYNGWELQHKKNNYQIINKKNCNTFFPEPGVTYVFAVMEDKSIRIATREGNGHPALTKYADVLYAGELFFKENGQIEHWTNESYTYQPNAALNHQAGLDINLFQDKSAFFSKNASTIAKAIGTDSVSVKSSALSRSISEPAQTFSKKPPLSTFFARFSVTASTPSTQTDNPTQVIQLIHV